MCADMNGFNLYALNVNVNVTFKLSIHQKSIMYLIYQSAFESIQLNKKLQKQNSICVYPLKVNLVLQPYLDGLKTNRHRLKLTKLQY